MAIFILWGGLGLVLGAVAGALFPHRLLIVIGVGCALATAYVVAAFIDGCEPYCENWQILTVFAGVSNALAWALAAAGAAAVRRRAGRGAD